jgi:hypothetical protein
MAEIVTFLEDVLTMEQRPGWRRLFERLGGFFNATFGPDWQKDEKDFWDEVASGQYGSDPVLLKK